MSGRGEIVIQQDNDSGRLAYWQATDHQSLADRHGISVAPYIHALYGFIRQARAKHVLMIGCGGGTLATMLVRAGKNVTIVDIDPASFAVARRYFHLPKTVACHAADGAAFLRAGDEIYDAIVLDAYAGGQVPRHLVRTSFFEKVKQRLKPGGIVLMNMIAADDEDRVPDRIGWRLRKSFRRVMLLDAEGELDRNVILLAGGIGKLKRPRLTLRPGTGSREIAAALKQMEFRRLKL